MMASVCQDSVCNMQRVTKLSDGLKGRVKLGSVWTKRMTGSKKKNNQTENLATPVILETTTTTTNLTAESSFCSPS